ncbi:MULTISPECIES: hypothetical protein [Rhodococcus]|uniref:Uncharacterized protein n=1 Tax=Rhodococcus erythropolis TaxID=1833 RepID=A0A8I1D6H8_RHOER|nr:MULTISPECIES: hypothetical protein [Rhodococcus]MBH5143282.1 hypothetical protein [Rhodococcus erythropolis]MBT1254490.1 hypothetical protein [Rhodococcus erythropolis]NRH34091.1 hypothetical protein [Rhodococcus sp. MS13]OHF30024.1 hypothetical protein BKP30_00200 [Rhodococcus erythropolis]QSE41062.1 hypothetical protein JXX30_27815 [Rhodococcus erythropolis]
MSAITDYFTARTDEHATSALEGLVDLEPAVIEANDASRPRIQLAADGTSVLQAKGVDPVVALGRLEAALTARPYNEVAKGPRCGKLVAMSDDGDTLVLTVTDELRDALAELNAEGVAAAAAAWAIDETSEPSEDSVPFLTAFAELATRAVAQGERMYGYVVI